MQGIHELIGVCVRRGVGSTLFRDVQQLHDMTAAGMLTCVSVPHAALETYALNAKRHVRKSMLSFTQDDNLR